MGAGLLIEQLHISGNASYGVRVDLSSAATIVRYNTVHNNRVGIAALRALVAENAVEGQRLHGISLGFGRAINNIVTGNAGSGLSLGPGTQVSYTGNFMRDNGTHVTGGTNLGQNICGPSVCPAASY